METTDVEQEENGHEEEIQGDSEVEVAGETADKAVAAEEEPGESNEVVGNYDSLPLYKCHKKVRAAKIMQIEKSEYSGKQHAILFVEEAPDGKVIDLAVDAAYLTRCPKLAVGGYFVCYEQLPTDPEPYTSYSPAGAFEGGYTEDTEINAPVSGDVEVDYILMRSEVLELGKRIFGPAVEMTDGNRVFNLTVGGEIVHSFRY